MIGKRILRTNVLFSLLCSCTAFGIFEHDRAVLAAQHGDWKKAENLLKTTVIDSPQSASVLYDAGVASYKVGDVEKAQVYFEAAIKAARDSESFIKEQALFNSGNAFVQQKKLHEAIEQYEKALAIKPDDEHAKHNLEVVKKMLEQQQQQKNQDQKNDQQDKDDQSSDQKKQQQKKDQEDGARSKEQQEGDGSEQKSSERNEELQQKKGGQEKKQQQDKKQDKDAENKGENDDQEDDQQSPANREQQEKKSQENRNRSGSQRAKGAREPKLDPQLAQLLDKQEKADANLNKQLIKANVGKQLAGYHGQNCW